MKSSEKWELAGWLLFVLCAMLFIAASLKNKDPLSLMGSVVFLLACFAFLIPLIVSRKE